MAYHVLSAPPHARQRTGIPLTAARRRMMRRQATVSRRSEEPSFAVMHDSPLAQTDADLMGAIRSGHAEALQALYDRYFKRGYGLALRILGDTAAAEDCVQDVFLKLWQQPHLFDVSRGSFLSWFLTTVHNRACNALRRDQRTQPLAPAGAAPDAAPPSEPADRRPGQSSVEDSLATAEAQRAVRAALTELSVEQRAALELAYFGGMTQSEIATYLHEPLGTVKTRIRNGMIKLRASLELRGWGKDMELG
jgi:RNA polymerase sigma-70 factor (ECF subfamily)